MMVDVAIFWRCCPRTYAAEGASVMMHTSIIDLWATCPHAGEQGARGARERGENAAHM